MWVEPSGNNHPLVKSILKKRTWFSTHHNFDPSGETNNTQNSFYNEESKFVAPPNLIWTQLRRPRLMHELTHNQIYNHLDGINCIASKTGLFTILRNYYSSN